MMKLIVFAVEEGLCAYVRTPNDHGILIDCGRGALLSPAEWLAENEAPSLKAVSLVVTHPHESHLADLKTVTERLSPAALPCEPAPDFGATVRCFSLSQAEAEQLGGCEDRVVDNQSVVTVVSYKSDEGYAWKVVVAGDNQADGWEALLAKPEFCSAIAETDFFVTSSHGQESGFCAELFKAMGRPIANISSSRAGAERADAKYKKSAQGVKFPDGKRAHFITPDDGNITVEMRDDGNYDVWLFRP